GRGLEGREREPGGEGATNLEIGTQLLFHKDAHWCIFLLVVVAEATEAFRSPAGARPPSVHGGPTAEVNALRYQPSCPAAPPVARVRPEGTGKPVPLAFFLRDLSSSQGFR